MAIYRSQFTIPYFTGLPTDVVTNDWHTSFIVGTPGDSEFEELRDLIVAFYDTIYAGSLIGDCMAPWADPAGAYIKIYNVNDPTPRAPRYQSAAPLLDSTVATSGTPLEEAVCASYKGTPISGVPVGRQRGRIFLGMLGGVNGAGDPTHFPTVDPTFAQTVCDAMEQFKSDAFTAGWLWVVFSRVGNVGYAVSSGWVDDAFDTQRRRGNAPSTRIVWP